MIIHPIYRVELALQLYEAAVQHVSYSCHSAPVSFSVEVCQQLATLLRRHSVLADLLRGDKKAKAPENLWLPTRVVPLLDAILSDVNPLHQPGLMVLRSKSSIIKFFLRLYLQLLSDSEDLLDCQVLLSLAPCIVKECIGKETVSNVKKAYEKDKADKSKPLGLICLEIFHRLLTLQGIVGNFQLLADRLVHLFPSGSNAARLDNVHVMMRWIRSELMTAIRDDLSRFYLFPPIF